MGRLRADGHDVRHVSLLARPETVLRRLSTRSLGRVLGERAALRREAFAVERVDRCLAALSDPVYAEHRWTDDLDVAGTAERVADVAGLPLRPADGRLRARARRAAVTVRHVRLP